MKLSKTDPTLALLHRHIASGYLRDLRQLRMDCHALVGCDGFAEGASTSGWKGVAVHRAPVIETGGADGKESTTTDRTAAETTTISRLSFYCWRRPRNDGETGGGSPLRPDHEGVDPHWQIDPRTIRPGDIPPGGGP